MIALLGLTGRSLYVHDAFVLVTPPFLADRFASILGGLQRALAANMVKRPAAEHAILMLLWSYLARRIRQYRRLAELVGRGKRPAPRAAAPPSAAPRPPRPPALRLPSRFAWLCPLVPGVAVYGYQLQALLAEPELQALLEAAPQQAGRIFRPLLRMLGTQTPSSLGRRASRPPFAAAAATIVERSDPAAPSPLARPGPPRCVRRGKTIRLGSFILPVPA